MSMNLPAQSPELIVAGMREAALRSFNGLDALRRSVTQYVIKCGQQAEGPNLEMKTLEQKYENLKVELGKAEARLSERPNDVERGRKVTDIKRTMGSVNRDKQAAFRTTNAWVVTGERLQELLLSLLWTTRL